MLKRMFGLLGLIFILTFGAIGCAKKEVIVIRDNYEKPSAGNQQVLTPGALPGSSRGEEHYLDSLEQAYYDALLIVNKYGYYAETCDDYYFNKPSSLRPKGREARKADNERERWKRLRASQCSRAKDAVAQAEATIRVYRDEARWRRKQ